MTVSDWPVMTIAELGGKITSGSRGWAKYYADTGGLFVRITNLRRESIKPDLSDPRYVQINPNESEASRTRLREGDLLISITADIGIIGYIDDDFPSPSYINQHIARVRLDPKRVNSKFVSYYLASWEPQRSFVGSTDQGAKAGINLATVAKLTTPLPSSNEQDRIVGALSDADDLIASLEQLIAKKRDVKQGMMQQLLTGSVRLSGLDSRWADVPISELAKVVGGGTPPTRVSGYWGGEIPWFTPSEIAQEGSDKVSVSNRTITYEGLANSSAHILPPGSVLVTSRASIGHCAVAVVPVSTNQGFASLVPHSLKSTWFLYYWIQQNKRELESRSAGSTFLKISARKVAEIPISAPGLDEQAAIGVALQDIDTEIKAWERRLESVQAIKQGMMQELLTGRTRLIKEVT